MANNIAEGAVFYFDACGIENHYHIIANVDATTGNALLLGVITSHVEMRKKDAEDMDESQETIVDISPEECICLKCNSVIDCNEPLVIKRSVLEQGIYKGVITYKCNVSKEITKKIRNGVEISKNANMNAKGLIY